MADPNEPVVLELAPLPREEIGPFLILGLDKDADQEAIEAHWAQRVIWARKNQTRLALEDINWAREVLNDPERRVRYDVSSLNPDTAEGTIGHVAERFGGEPGWKPLDREKDLNEYVPAAEVPDPEAVRSAIVLPEVPCDVPAAGRLLEQVLQSPLHPWAADLLGKGGPPLPSIPQDLTHE